MINRPAVRREERRALVVTFAVSSARWLVPDDDDERPPEKSAPSRRRGATGSYCLVVLLFRRVSPFESTSCRLGAPRPEQSDAKNIPCLGPRGAVSRDFLSALSRATRFLFAQIESLSRLIPNARVTSVIRPPGVARPTCTLRLIPDRSGSSSLPHPGAIGESRSLGERW